MSFVKDFLTFNKRERNGLFVLSFIIVVLVIFNFWLSFSEDNHSQPDFTAFEKSIKDFYNSSNCNTTKFITDSVTTTENDSLIVQPELFVFNPNTSSDNDFQKLGLNSKQINNIRNYLEKAGSFRFKEDFGKLYAIGDSLYAILQPYIDLPDKESYYASKKASYNKQEYPKQEIQKVQKPLLELNNADSLQLIEIKGIGPAFASRIIKYRNRLGGFQRVEQLMEVYGMKEEQFELIKSQVKVNPDVIIKININSCTAEVLKNHPYVNNWNIANALINYRKKHGMFKSVEEIKKCDLVNDELYLKLAPYLTLD
ncbi:MAG: helix-hairpin-helix domain-containing protein [Bacteroidia bacterium]